MADGRVTDATRIEAAVPTITELADKGAIVLILAHFDRPKGERRPDMSLSLVTRPLSEVLGRSVMFISDSHGPDAERSEEHTSELQSLMRISYAVFCLKKKKKP